MGRFWQEIASAIFLGPKRVHSAAQEASDLTIGPGDEGSWPCAETRWHGDSIHQQSMLPYKGRGVKLKPLSVFAAFS